MKITFPTIPRRSTRDFFREAKNNSNISIIEKLHGYVYIRWPYLYISIAKGDHQLVKIFGPLVNKISTLLSGTKNGSPDQITFADTYHGKVVPTDAAVQLVTIQEDIRINDLEQIIPYAKARSIVMVNPNHIVALDCPCRSISKEPCLPLDVCLIIGDPFASFVIEHHPNRARWINQDEAIEILELERDRGHVSHAFFKDVMLDRFYAICNCCKCCCGAMKAHQNGIPMLASSGFIAKVDEFLCTGCGDCELFCQFNAVSTAGGFSEIIAEFCMGCGVCVSHCKQDAILLIRDEGKGIPLEIHTLINPAIDGQV